MTMYQLLLRKKTNYKPTVLHAVLINKNIPKPQAHIQILYSSLFKKKCYSEKSYSASMGAHICGPITQKAAVGEPL